MDVRVGLWRRLSTEELKLLNCGVGEGSRESLGLQGDPTSPFWRRSALGFLWKERCLSWNSSTLATSCEELTHWKRPWCWEGLVARGEGVARVWDGWMASLTQWTWVWVNSGSWWWTGRPECCSSWGRKQPDTTERLIWSDPSDFTFTFHFYALEKEMATHSSVLAWRIPGTGEPGGLPSMGSHRVWHNWRDLAYVFFGEMSV